MSEVRYSRPWGLYFLGTMLFSVPGTMLFTWLSAEFRFIEGPALGIPMIAIWMSPAWAFMPLIYSLNSRVAEELPLRANYSIWRRHGRLAVYDDFFVVRQWDVSSGVRTSIVRFADVTRLVLPGRDVKFGPIAVEFRTEKGRDVVRWPNFFAQGVAEALEDGWARARSAYQSEASTPSPSESLNPTRRTAAS